MSKTLFIKSTSKIDLGLKVSPIVELQNYSDFYVKIDANNSKMSNFGGSKLRKLEYLLGSLQKDYGINEISSFGAFGSFHLKTISYWCKELGIKFHAKTWKQPWHIEEARNFVMTRKLSNSVRWMPSFLSLLYQGNVWKKSESHAIVPVGGDKISGAFAFYKAILELDNQMNISNSTIYVAAGTCATVAGLFLGASKLNKNISIIASNIVSKYIPVKSRILNIANQANLVYDIDTKFSNSELICKYSGETNQIIDYGFVQSDYSQMSKLANQNGFRIDPTYTAKTFRLALNDYNQNINCLEGPIIFWNTRP
jgi:1-aminocyclopropane-1-carboxylate deaminase/D-cysteine desulfhydrase-like pyridoxal-dependent ACC family enzyme